ncbi:class I SAM-dependent methyltransferase [Pelagibius sp. Alg239-R121]|uniref:class I SAM-dependent methyltransferase n=1 Tax=Pelagibius sp. Alg239-R121 TaxID=2993448 RepID=UPI0024A657E5|nr:class I SAM-dependent methyltransferase [Pelagibius sp. Alg239-R121]
MDVLLESIILVILLFIVLLLAYCFHKIRRIDNNISEILFRVMKIQRTDLVDIFQQRQNLDILQHELSLTRPLPPTRGWAASPDFLLIIARHASEAKPDTVVECSSGTSTVVLASCLRENGKGHVYSLENDKAFAETTRSHLEREGLSEWATVLHAPLVRQDVGERQFSWYDHQNLPDSAIDMIIVDGPPHLVGNMARYPAGPKLFTRLADGGTVFADDADRSEEEATLAAWRQEFPTFQEGYHYCEKGCISFRKPDTP